MDEVVARDVEREAVARFVAVAPQRTAHLALDGPAGIGKSTLFAHALVLARDSGAFVMRTALAEAERDLTYAGLTDLLAHVPDALLEALPEPQRDALFGATLRRRPARDGADQRAVGTGLARLLDTLAADGPLLIAIDDVQWLDRPTHDALAFALRRTAGPVGLLTTQRLSGFAVDATQTDELSASLGGDVWRERCTLGGLSLGAMFVLVRERLGETLSRLRLRRVWEWSGGNPLFALELVRSGAGLQSTDATPLSPKLHQLLSERLAPLSAEARWALLTAACAGRPAVEDVVVLGVEPGLREAEQVGIVHTSNGRVHFAHPLLAAAVIELADPDERRVVHLRLANVVEDVEARARHLATADASPDETTALALDDAAAAAERRGSVSAAVDLARLALDRTPPEDADSSRDAVLWRRKVTLARLLFAAGETAAAANVLAEREFSCPPGEVRAEAELLMAEIAFQTNGDAESAAACALEHAGTAGDLRARALLTASIVASRATDGARFAREARRSLESSASEDQLLRSWALIQEVGGELALGNGADRDSIMAAVTAERQGRTWRSTDQVACIAPVLLKWIDEHEQALRLLEELRHRAELEGNDGLLPYVLGHVPSILIRLGRLHAAHAAAQEHLAAAEATDQAGQRCQADYNLACALAFLGELDEARERGQRCLDLALAHDDPWLIAASHGVLGFIALSRRNVHEARRHLDAWHVAAARAELVDPGISRYHHDHIEALVASGDIATATARTEEFNERADRASRASARALAARCRALLLAHQGDTAGALALLDEALDHDDRSPVPFERARTLMLRGTVHRRRREKASARAALEEALATFETVGATAWAERTGDEIERLGQRAANHGGLTSSERRVAELAAAGLTNRQVAEQAFISAKTVEANLAKIYRKLGISSRAELGARMRELTAGAEM